MSEYWVSKKKYFCKYCDIYIADDAPSRQQHESGLRHKGNVERFIRGIYKAGEKQKKDLEEEKREMKRVEQAAAAAHAQDVAAGLSKPSMPVASASSAAKKPPPKPSNPFANYSTAQSLGYIDPDAERIAAEVERRQSQGIAGEWQMLTPTPPPISSTPEVISVPSEPSTTTAGETGVKREAEAPLDDDDTRAFKLRKKTLAIGEIYDPGVMQIKLKKKEEPNLEPIVAPIPSSARAAMIGAPKWTPTQWKRPGEDIPTGNGVAIKADKDALPVPSKWTKPQWSQPLPDLKKEERKSIFGNPESDEQKPEIKTEPSVKPEDAQSPALSEGPSSTGSLFKKRKAPTGAGRGRQEIK